MHMNNVSLDIIVTFAQSRSSDSLQVVDASSRSLGLSWLGTGMKTTTTLAAAHEHLKQMNCKCPYKWVVNHFRRQYFDFDAESGTIGPLKIGLPT